MGVARVRAANLATVDPGPAAAQGRGEAAAGLNRLKHLPIAMWVAGKAYQRVLHMESLVSVTVRSHRQKAQIPAVALDLMAEPQP